MSNSTFLYVSELFIFSIACLQSLPAEHTLTHFLRVSEEITLKDFATTAAFLLADVAHVGIAGSQKTDEEKNHVSVAMIVPRIWLVPVRELSRVLVSKRSLVTDLHLTINPNITVNEKWLVIHSQLYLICKLTLSRCEESFRRRCWRQSESGGT